MQGASDLAEALGEMGLGSSAAAAWDERGRPILRGMPQAHARHTRFADDGSAVDSPGSGAQIVALKGLPRATGTHTRFDASFDDSE